MYFYPRLRRPGVLCCAACARQARLPCLRRGTGWVATGWWVGLGLSLWLCGSAAVAQPQAAALTPPVTCPRQAGWAAGPPAHLRHSFEVQGRSSGGFTYTASAQIDWQSQPGQNYRLGYEVTALLGIRRSQTSVGNWAERGLTPNEFIDQAKKSLKTRADVGAMRVKLPLSETELPLLTGSQDKLSVMAQLGWWVACAPASFPLGRLVELPVWATRDTEHWVLRSNGLVALSTPYGIRQAIHLTRHPSPNDSARLDLWYVPEWGALPVRIEIKKNNGETVEQTLKERLPAD